MQKANHGEIEALWRDCSGFRRCVKYVTEQAGKLAAFDVVIERTGIADTFDHMSRRDKIGALRVADQQRRSNQRRALPGRNAKERHNVSKERVA